MKTLVWIPVRPGDARSLTDARLQVHHAAQLATAAGISYLPRRADDGHTNLEWLAELGALASNPIPADGGTVRVALRVADLALFLLNGGHTIRDTLPLRGQTMARADEWLRERLRRAGLDAARYTLKRHYEIPAHGVATGDPFTAGDAHLGQLAAWFANATLLLEALRASRGDASEVRCWPHHFDVATLITVAPGRTVGAGLEPGDQYYDEPYFYVNAHPPPAASLLQAGTLEGGGAWHTREWIGAVLPGSRVRPDPAAQEQQVHDFLRSAVAACEGLLAA